MDHTISRMAAAPLAWQHEGKTYQLSPLRLVDFGELDLYSKSLPLIAVRGALHGMPEDAARYVLALAMSRIERLAGSLDRTTFVSAIENPLGLAYALWLSLRQRHELTLDQVQGMVTFANRAEVSRLIDLLAGFEVDPKQPEPQPAADGLGQADAEHGPVVPVGVAASGDGPDPAPAPGSYPGV